MKVLRFFVLIGMIFSPLFDGGIRLGNYRILIFDIYFLLLAVFTLIIIIKAQNICFRFDFFKVIIIIYVTSWFFSTFYAYINNFDTVGIIKNIQLLFFALVIAYSVEKIDDMRLYLSGIIFADFWVSIIGWIQSLFGNEAFLLRKNLQINAYHFLGDRVVTAFTDPIMSGQFLSVGLCLVIGIALVKNPSSQRHWLFVLSLIILLPLITSGSRGPIASGVITILILLLKYWRSKNFLQILSLTLIIGIVVLVSGYFSHDMFIVAFDRISLGFSSKRFDYWFYILQTSKLFPLGVGFNNFSNVSPMYIPDELSYIYVSNGISVNTHAESMYLTQLIETGWLGLFSFVCLILFSISKCWNFSLIPLISKSRKFREVTAGLLGAWISYSLCMISAYGYNNLGIAMLFWSLVGFTISLVKIERQNISIMSKFVNRIERSTISEP